MEITLEMLASAYGNILTISQYQIFYGLVLFDVFTGLGKAIIKKRMNSTIGVNGMVKHFVILAMVTLIGPYLSLLNLDWVAWIFIRFFMAGYGISILENAEAIGAPLPKWFKEFFEKMRADAEDVNVSEIVVTLESPNDKKDDEE